MVVTPLMWKSLDRYSRYFDILWKNPLEWDVKRKTFIFTPISRRLVPWMICVYGFLSIFNLTLIMLLISHLFGVAQLEFVNIVVILCFTGGAVFTTILESLLMFGGKNAAYAINSMFALAKKLCNVKYL